jgi:hypothetical protein
MEKIRPSIDASDMYPELLGLNLVQNNDLRTNSYYFTLGSMAGLYDWGLEGLLDGTDLNFLIEIDSLVMYVINRHLLAGSRLEGCFILSVIQPVNLSAFTVTEY